MSLTRRQFLGLMGGSSAAAVLFQACGVPEKELLIQSPIEMPEDLVSGMENWYATLCRQCPTSESIVVRVMEGRAKKIEGNIDYPINQGKHSARCEAGLQSLYHPDRISAPRVRMGERGSGKWEEISWTDAISRLANSLLELDDHSQMVMVTNPITSHLGSVTERFVSKFGGRHVNYEPLEETTLRTAISHVFGQTSMPDFDIQNSSYLLSFGADFLNTWISPVRYSRSYGEFRQGDRKRGTMVHVDSRFSMTGANADEWFYVNPGMEGVLALSIANVIVSEGLGEPSAVQHMTNNNPSHLSAFEPEKVATIISNAAPPEKISEKIRHIARDFANNRPSLAIGGGSTAAHTNGLFNLIAIYSLNYLVGSVNTPGGIILNPKSALEDVITSPTQTPFEVWPDLVSEMNQDKVKVLMVRGSDPMYGLPENIGFQDATFKIPLIVSFSNNIDDTTAMADLILPEHDPLEDWGTDIPNPGPGYQTVGFQQPVVRPFFESRAPHFGSKSFPDTLLATAKALEIDLEFPGNTFKDIIRDGAKQLFDTGKGSVKAPNFETFWNGILQRGGWWDTTARYSGNQPTPPILSDEIENPDFFGPSDHDSFYLVPFASTSLTDGRGAHLPWLQATPDPITSVTWRTWVEINLNKAKELNIKEGDVIRLSSTHGSIEALAYPHPGISPEIVSVPVGQGHKSGGQYAKGRGSNILSILAPAQVKKSGALAWASTRVNIERTGESMSLPKFENSAPDLAVDRDQHVIQITSHDS